MSDQSDFETVRPATVVPEPVTPVGSIPPEIMTVAPGAAVPGPDVSWRSGGWGAAFGADAAQDFARKASARLRKGDRPPRGGAATMVRGIWRAVTPLGRTVAAAGVISWILAARFGWEEMAVVGAACLLAVLAGVVFLLMGQADLGVRLDLGTRRVVVGDPAMTLVEATNQASRRMLPIRLEARVGRGIARVNVPGLGAGATHDELFVIPTSRRSVVPVGPVRSVQGDPLGLVRREVIWTGTEELFVHPRTVALGPLTTGWRRDLEGETTNDRSPSDVAFHTLREYVIGDDRRHIHWRTTARQTDGKLMVREFVDTRQAHVAIVLSMRSEDYADPGEFELAVSSVASLGRRAIGDDQEVTCLAGARSVPTHHGVAFLDSLARLERGDDALDVAAVARRGRDEVVGASVGVVVVGSRADVALARSAAERLGSMVQTLVLRVDAKAVSARRPGPGTTVLEVGLLEDLPRLVAAGLGR